MGSKGLFAALAAGFMAIALTACGGGTVAVTLGGTDPSIDPTTPTITIHPAAQTVSPGQTASFTVAASGTGPLAYQWKKNDSTIAGATLSTYTTPATSSADNGASYSVSVSNSAGTVTSNKAALTVSASPGVPGVPAIGTQPANQSVVVGQTATFTVTASGTGPFTYQWQKNGTNISGATTSTYTTPATTVDDDGAQYGVVVGNSDYQVSDYKVSSSKATLTVTAAAVAPAITNQPAETQTVTAGQPATFSVTATGTAPLIYQWKKNGADIASNVPSSTYTIAATSEADSGVYSVVVSNSTGTPVTSNHATLTVSTAAVAITAQPAALAITAGQTATFSVTATGTSPNYQWRRNGTPIVGATSSSYTTPDMSIAGSGVDYSVVVSNSAGSVTSSNATLTVNPNPSANPKYSLVANASGGTHDKTECVKDNSTGFIWEGKTADGDRKGNLVYSNFDSTDIAQKRIGFGTDTINPTEAEVYSGFNTAAYRIAVNASTLCGFTDWRMPTQDEMLGIVDASQAAAPYINSLWFPYSFSAYWTSSPSAIQPAAAISISFNYPNGQIDQQFRTTLFAVRLVRGNQ